jgi:hypothetical protein
VGVLLAVGVLVLVGVNVIVDVNVIVGVNVCVGVALGKSNPGIVVSFCMAVPCTTVKRTPKTARPISTDLRITAPYTSVVVV